MNVSYKKGLFIMALSLISFEKIYTMGYSQYYITIDPLANDLQKVGYDTSNIMNLLNNSSITRLPAEIWKLRSFSKVVPQPTNVPFTENDANVFNYFYKNYKKYFALYLFKAIKDGNFKQAKELIEGNYNDELKFGWWDNDETLYYDVLNTALTLAIFYERADIAKLLIANSADLDAQDINDGIKGSAHLVNWKKSNLEQLKDFSYLVRGRKKNLTNFVEDPVTESEIISGNVINKAAKRKRE